MKRTIKVVAVVLGIIVILLVAAVIALPLLINPNSFKPQIAQAVKAQTGRDLQINQSIHWSVFPWLGIRTGGLVLSNAPGFGPTPFAKIGNAGVRVKLLPLLHRRVEVDRIVLSDATINLAKDREGRTNWADLVKPSKTPAAPQSKKGGGAPPISALTVGGIDVSGTQVTWNDEQAGTRASIKNLALHTGSLGSGQATPVTLNADVTLSKPAIKTHVALKSTVALNLGRQQLDVSQLALDVLGLSLTGNVHGEHILGAAHYTGAAQIASFNPKSLLAQLGTRVQTTDPKAFTQAALKTQFALAGSDLRLDKFNATLDDSTLAGNASILDFAHPAYRFDLALDNFNLDRYLPPATTNSKPAPGAAAPAAPVVIPVETLRQLDLDGRFRIQRLQAFNIHSSGVLVRAYAKNGLVKIDPSEAQLYGGNYKGTVSYDARTNNPLLNVNEQLSGVQLGAFLKDAMGFDKFSGKGNLSAKVSAHGFNAERIKSTLTGTAGFQVADGTIQGVDLKKMSDEIQGLAKSNRNTLLKNASALIPQKTDVTRFSQLKGTAQIQNGVAHNRDLMLQIPGFATVTGSGSADIVKQTLDYTVNLTGNPLRVHGPWTSLKFEPDWQAILKKQLGNRAQQKERKYEEQLKQKLNQRLQGLFK